MIPKKIAKFLYWKAEKYGGSMGIEERLEWLTETQNLSPQEIKTIQLAKLNLILHHCYDTVPYYARVFKERGIHPDDITTEEDLQKIPILSRDILIKHQKDLLSTKADHGSLKVNYSSGSTGKRAVFQQDKNFRLWMRAHQIRTYGWCSEWELGEKFVLLWGSDIYWNIKSVKDKVINLLSNRREFNTFKLSSQLITDFTRALCKFDPVLISSYSNALYLISLEAKKQNLHFPSLRAIQTTSEPMPVEMRQRIKNSFGCEVFDKYGSRETNIVSHESPQHDGMLIQAENIVVEFLNEKKALCKPKEMGTLILTTLNNFSMPLIRYETQDIAAPIEGFSAKSYQFPRMTSVSGRQQDLIYTPNGDYIDSYFFSFLLMRFENINWFQIIQNNYEELLIRVLAPNGLTQENKSEILERITHHTGYNFKVIFEEMTELPSSTTGKYRLCISNIKESQHVSTGILEAS